MKHLALLALGLGAAVAHADGFTTVPTTIQFEAGAGLYRQWSGGGMTWHTGVGYIEPYGAATYFCGVGYAEQKQFPMPAYIADLVKTQTADSNPLFCIYQLKNGSLYVYDAVVGNLFTDSASTDKKDQLINIVVGGSGEFTGATGLWVGDTQGRGEVAPVASGQKLPTSILKLMSGYIRLPRP